LRCETLALTQATSFKTSPRTYDAAPYAKADAFCPRPCGADADCTGGAACYIPSQRRWSSAVGCSPSSAWSGGCGCCAPEALPALRAFTIACGGAGAGGTAQDAAGQSGAVGGYELSVCAGGVAITSASARGAANALSTLAQLLRYDTELRTHVIDFVPLQIRDQPELGWRGWTSGGAVIQHWHSLLRP
jgi:hypothetical protein